MGKIALEEHFNLPDFSDDVPQYVSPELMREINRRLLDLGPSAWGRWMPPVSISPCCR
ncbi:hypothetical protein POF50_029800 [Streptomyces sp. SL13]|uniref:Uncharacterized protein n=1 Tax=Streptantibioticus silvisoli TaxID=2705255 RepID=A0AA90H3L9_9ACTN|nr:hypothetical protein [Streptantibioticus silvisoli]MDI5973488.1 hypothetical protein [Streptantibioticus silvisoli]